MNIANIKLPIVVIGIIVAQAFGIIWYVANVLYQTLDEDYHV